ncbi:MAG: hypothetical protein IH598_12595 [Bacteroidales bacterium]|nr:hypothetical protein [Bacteroidales bacterium]
MKNLFFIILLFTCTPYYLFSDTIPLHHYSGTSFYIFRFGRGEPPDMSNYFVRELANINYVNPYRTSYSIEYGLEVEINALDGNRLEVKSSFLTKKLFGDVAYKEFDLSEVLEPTIYGFSLTVSLGNKNIVLFEPGNLTTEEMVVNIVQLEKDFELEKAEYIIANIHSTYDDGAIGRFDRRMSEIHEYLATLELVGYSLDKAHKIDPERENNFFSTYIRIYELESVQSYLQGYRLKPELKVPTQYSSAFQADLVELNSHLRQLRTTLSNTLDLQGYLFDDETYAEAAKTVLSVQADYIGAVTTINHFYEPVFLQMAGFIHSTDDWLKLISDASQTFAALDAETLRKRFSQQLWSSYLAVAEDYFNADKFNEALVMLTSAGVICNSNPEIDCGLQVFHNISKAKFGIYDSYLHIAESAMSVNNLNLARHYLNLARDFQSNNSSLIIIPAAVLNLMEDLAWLYFEEGRKAVREEKWDAALDHLTAAREIYTLLKFTTFDEAIEKELSKIGK